MRASLETDGGRPIDIFGQAVALTIGTLLPIMNPFGALPLFHGAGAQLGRKEPQACGVGRLPLRLCPPDGVPLFSGRR